MCNKSSKISNISIHIKNIFQDKELDQKVVCADFAHTTKHGSVKNKTQFSNQNR
jgi:hypothetical protein